MNSSNAVLPAPTIQPRHVRGYLFLTPVNGVQACARAKLPRMPHVAPTPEQTCGRCEKFEPSRNDPEYGYCKPQIAWETERARGAAAPARLVHVSEPCFMVVWHGLEERPAFVAREAS